MELVVSSSSSSCSLHPTLLRRSFSRTPHSLSFSPTLTPTLSIHLRRTPPLAASSVQAEPLLADVVVSETKLPNSTVKLNVQVPPAVCQDCQKEVLQELTKRVKVPGFRPGKRIPENILINYIGKEQVQRATIESILKRTLPNATSSVKGRALKDSIHIVTKFTDMNETFSIDDFFRYDVVADLAPEVKWLTQDRYKNMNIVIEIDSIINAETTCDLEMKRRHKALGSLKVVTDRGLEIGDLVVLDIFATRTKQDGSEAEKIPSSERTGFHLDTEETNSLLPGFLESIIGIRQGETRSFELLFPDTWEQENLRGVHAEFTVECKEHFYRELPELDDSLANKLLPGCETIDQVRESLLSRCKEMEQTARDQATDNAILDQLCKIVEVEIPPSLFEEQGRQLYAAKLLELQANKKLDEQQLAFLTSEKTVNEYLESQREAITRIIKQMLAVDEIYKSENLQYSTEELTEEIEKSVAEFKRHNQDYEEDNIKEQVQDVLEGAKVLEWLRENSRIQYINK